MGNENGYRLWHMVVSFVLGAAVTGAAILIPASGGQGFIALQKPQLQTTSTQSDLGICQSKLNTCQTNLNNCLGSTEGTSPTVSVQLNPSSPTGTRSVAYDDKILMFDVSVLDADFAFGGVEIYLNFDDGDIENSTVPFKLKMGNSVISTVDSTTQEGSNYLRKVISISGSPSGLILPNGSSNTFSISTSTADLISEDAGTDDHLAIALVKITDINGNVVFEGSGPNFTRTLKY